MIKIVVFILSLIVFAPLSHAQAPMPGSAPMDQAPMFQGMKMGVMNGVLFRTENGKKIPIPNQKVTITVFHDGEEMLALDKPTDASGTFQFKRIFKDSSYSYHLGTVINGKTYHLHDLTLDPSKDSLDVEFEVGDQTDSSAEGAEEGALPPGHPSTNDDPSPQPQNMPPMNQMPQFAGMEMGVINGTLVQTGAGKKKVPVKDHTVGILVFQNGKQVLMLNKKSDASGHFQFKNIFKDPSFSYSLGSMLDEQIYVIEGLTLDGKDKKDVEFLIGAGSPYLIDKERLAREEGGSAPEGPSDMLNADRKKNSLNEGFNFWKYSYQKAALVLGGLVLALAFYFLAKPKQGE